MPWAVGQVAPLGIGLQVSRGFRLQAAIADLPYRPAPLEATLRRRVFGPRAAIPVPQAGDTLRVRIPIGRG